MNKVKEIIKWISIDGYMHITTMWLLILLFNPIVGLWKSLAIAIIAGASKEAYDFFIEKDNTKEQMAHDLICDVVGLLLAMVTIVLWEVFVI